MDVKQKYISEPFRLLTWETASFLLSQQSQWIDNLEDPQGTLLQSVFDERLISLAKKNNDTAAISGNALEIIHSLCSVDGFVQIDLLRSLCEKRKTQIPRDENYDEKDPLDAAKEFAERTKSLVDEVKRVYQELKLPYKPLTLVHPDFICPLPKFQVSVFPPQIKTPPPPPLEKFDLDQLFGSKPQTNSKQLEEMKQQELQQALEKGAKAWNHSKLIILGEGRAGKTAFANSIMGKTFSETASTIGIAEFTCEIKYAKVGNGEWGMYEKPMKELEVALARMIQNRRENPENKTQKKNNIPLNNKAGATPLLEEMKFEDEITAPSSFVQRKALDKPSAQPSQLDNNDKNTEKISLTDKISSDGKNNGKEEKEYTAKSILPTRSGNEGNKTSLSTATQKDLKPRALPVPAITPLEVDNELVAKCLTNQLNSIDSKFTISLYDFGGQSVFNVIHPFFLTCYGVYAVVFNMEWLVGGTANPYFNQCLSYMNFWVNSIVIHTYSATLNETAPLLFIGTRKDLISSPKDHEKISLSIYEKFHNHICWPFVLENSHGESSERGRCNLWFFPINNTLSRQDKTLKYVMEVVENAIDGSEYVHEEKPLIWLKTVDRLKALQSQQRTVISYREMVSIAHKECGVPLMLIPELLSFLHEMGIVMWHSEESLKDIIILDPIEYFVKPSTILICKHQPTANDPTHHLLDIHKLCRKRFYEDWQIMLEYGLVSSSLLLGLLQQQDPDHQKKLIYLMIKYGLIVPVSFEEEEATFAEQNSSMGNDTEIENQRASDNNKVPKEDEMRTPLSKDIVEITKLYLVPALLPNMSLVSSIASSSVSSIQQKYQYMIESFHPNLSATFYFVFGTSKFFDNQSILMWKDLQEYGFLPNGLFERLIGKAISWCQETSSSTMNNQSGEKYRAASSSSWNYEDYLICQSEAILNFGNQRFHLINHLSHNLIQVEIEGSNPMAIHERLLSQLKIVIDECMKYLKVYTFVPFLPRNSGSSNTEKEEHLRDVFAPPADISNSDQLSQQKQQQPQSSSILLIKLNKIIQTTSQRNELSYNFQGKRSLLSYTEIFKHFTLWLNGLLIKDEYDLFLSYRWGSFDSQLVQGIYDNLTLHVVTKQYRSINTFLDKYRLQEGKDLSNDFLTGLLSSKMVVPVVSSDSLQKLCSHDPNIVDNLLLEWCISLEAYQLYKNHQQNKKIKETEKSDVSSSVTSQKEEQALARCKIQRILPIFIGSHQRIYNKSTNSHSQVMIGNLFRENLLQELPEIVPIATLNKAIEVLRHNGLTPSKEFAEFTVKQILQKMSSFLGVLLWEFQHLLSSHSLIKRCTEKLLLPLHDTIIEEEKEEELKRLQKQLRVEEEKERLLKENNKLEEIPKSLENTPKANFSSTASPVNDYSTAWKCLNDADNSLNFEDLKKHLADLGVKTGEDLADLDKEDIDEICKFLKKVPQKQLKRALNML